MMKFFQKMDRNAFLVQFFAFLWILVCNVIVQLLHEPLASAGIPGWTIFLANVLFFIKSNPNHKEGLLENACGGIFGLIGAIGLINLNLWLVPLGVAPLLATLIAIAVFLFLTIAIHPLVPYVFNNNALCFFLVALLNTSSQEALLTYPWMHFVGVILGNLIVNIGTILIVELVAKHLRK